MSKNTHPCTPRCPYFPDMNLSEQEWTYDAEKYYKVRKRQKIFKCLYDGEPINWSKECSYVIKEKKK